MQAASELGIHKEKRRREKELPVEATVWPPKGHVQSRSVRAASKAATHPPVHHPGHAGGASGREGAQRNAAREGRLTRAMKLIKYVFPRPREAA